MHKPTVTGIHATLAPANDPPPKSFVWGLLKSGDCTMFEGARLTVFPNHRAYFSAVVTSSDDNDAWLTWLHLRDAANHELGMIEADFGDPDDSNKFVKDLPDHTQQYPWNAVGEFWGPYDFNMIAGAVMDYHC
ncbi:MAG: DUF6294 family protein [Pseudonocardiaceae bacterium]